MSECTAGDGWAGKVDVPRTVVGSRRSTRCVGGDAGRGVGRDRGGHGEIEEVERRCGSAVQGVGYGC